MHSQHAIMNQIAAIAAISDQIGYRCGRFLGAKKDATDAYMETLKKQYNEEYIKLENMIDELYQTKGGEVML